MLVACPDGCGRSAPCIKDGCFPLLLSLLGETRAREQAAGIPFSAACWRALGRQRAIVAAMPDGEALLDLAWPRCYRPWSPNGVSACQRPLALPAAGGPGVSNALKRPEDTP